ncbi:MAG: hypothetical protein IT161_23935 [Bryobacterales bacterium]|nr:hypothetical protein [Bryobacterales bacterium]
MTMENNADVAPARVQMTIPELRRPQRAAEPRLDKAAAPARLPRVTRLMALAVKYQGMISRGELEDYADIARLGYITRARATQVMNLLHLAPDIQEQLLLPDDNTMLAGTKERDLRKIARVVYWKKQRELWRQTRTGTQT